MANQVLFTSDSEDIIYIICREKAIKVPNTTGAKIKVDVLNWELFKKTECISVKAYPKYALINRSDNT